MMAVNLFAPGSPTRVFAASQRLSTLDFTALLGYVPPGCRLEHDLMTGFLTDIERHWRTVVRELGIETGEGLKILSFCCKVLYRQSSGVSRSPPLLSDFSEGPEVLSKLL